MRTERVNQLENALNLMSQSIGEIFAEIGQSMSNKLTEIATLKRALAEDNAELNEIAVVVDNFQCDLGQFVMDIDKFTDNVEVILDDLDNIPVAIVDDEEEEVEETEDFSLEDILEEDTAEEVG
jgi:seryl-tRNA synthetase